MARKLRATRFDRIEPLINLPEWSPLTSESGEISLRS